MTIDAYELDDPPEPLSRPQIAAVLGALAAMAVVAALVVVVVAGMSRGDTTQAAAAASHGTVAPLDLSAVPETMAGHYTYAAAHTTEYQQVPCWCGCEQFLGHRHLADCFVRADGQGWEAHAAGCGVCIAEAAIAETTLDRGGTSAQIKAAVDAQFGSTSITTPRTSN